MKLQLQSDRIEDYLTQIPPVISWDTPLVQEQIKRIKRETPTRMERAKLAFELARDGIRHSFDTQYKGITISAEEALAEQEGICFAKSHLLASLLRGLGIPAGFCYQRVTRKETPESGYALHGLNALYLKEYGWFRVDPRGNKAGINSQFSPEEEKLAYPIRKELGEVDYPHVFIKPLQSVLAAMRDSGDCRELFFKRPEAVEV